MKNNKENEIEWANRLERSLNKVAKLENDNKKLKHFIKISHSNFMCHGLLQLSAWMGIPEKKRQIAIKEILDNYEYAINETMKSLEVKE